jgi:cytoplasmic FMR1 interacting protein
VGGHEKVVLDAIELAVDTLDDSPDNAFYQVLTPDEWFRLLRVVPYLLLLADGDQDGGGSFSIFKTNKIKLSSVQKLLKRYPVVPLYGDMCITIEYVLQQSVHYDKQSMGSVWGAADSDKLTHYDIKTHWKEIRESFSQFSVSFVAIVNKCKQTVFKKLLNEVNIDSCSEIFHLVCSGFQKLSKWKIALFQMLAWKYTHPCSMEHIELEEKSTVESNGIEYDRVLRRNLDKGELSVIVDVVSMIKAAATLLAKEESFIAPFIRFHVHHRIQQLVQGDLTPLLHRLDKRNKPILPSLLKVTQ